MKRLRAATDLVAEIVQLARAKRAYWLIPLTLILGLAGLVVVAGESVAPLIYTLF